MNLDLHTKEPSLCIGVLGKGKERLMQPSDYSVHQDGLCRKKARWRRARDWPPLPPIPSTQHPNTKRKLVSGWGEARMAGQCAVFLGLDVTGQGPAGHRKEKLEWMPIRP
ncbi:hypothetical protein O3P69_001689 [Scylla paramamosain]|uniref:Uncharacterized protein n=1 Tax=Scylla paramamosain TaxID=85552 RepID=A0AAW0V0A8_SCYPA